MSPSELQLQALAFPPTQGKGSTEAKQPMRTLLKQAQSYCVHDFKVKR
jgi:hypothetical protein